MYYIYRSTNTENIIWKTLQHLTGVDIYIYIIRYINILYIYILYIILYIYYIILYGIYILSGWWFGTFFIFPYIGKNNPN